MPINPDTRFVLEAKMLEKVYAQVSNDVKKLTSLVKWYLITDLPLAFVSITLGLIIIFMNVHWQYRLVMLCVQFIIAALAYLMANLLKNLAMNQDMYDNVQNIIYGDKYAIPEINPEELSNITSTLQENHGKMEMLYECFRISWIIELAVNGFITIVDIVVLILMVV